MATHSRFPGAAIRSAGVALPRALRRTRALDLAANLSTQTLLHDALGHLTTENLVHDALGHLTTEGLVARIVDEQRLTSFASTLLSDLEVPNAIARVMADPILSQVSSRAFVDLFSQDPPLDNAHRQADLHDGDIAGPWPPASWNDLLRDGVASEPVAISAAFAILIVVLAWSLAEVRNQDLAEVAADELLDAALTAAVSALAIAVAAAAKRRPPR